MLQKKKSNGLDYSIFQGSSVPPHPSHQSASPKNGIHNNKNTSSSSIPTTSPLRLVTYNMAKGNAGPQYQYPRGCSGANISHHDVRRHLIETELLEMRPDVICCQESMIQSSDWGYRDQNTCNNNVALTKNSSSASTPPSAASLAASAAALSRASGFSRPHSSVVVSKTLASNAALLKEASVEIQQQHQQQPSSSSLQDSSFPPHFKRTKEVAVTHCGMTFMYVNSKTYDILYESKIASIAGGGNTNGTCPQFPVMAITSRKYSNKKANHDHPSEPKNEEKETEKDQQVVYMICSIHLHPFPNAPNHKIRQQQFSHVLSELNRLEKEWFTARRTPLSSKKYKIVKLIAGDTNMTNEQFPSFATEPSKKVLDCWFEYHFGTQMPSGSVFKANPVPYFIPELEGIPKFFHDSYTFGGDNDYNQSSMKELRRFQIGKMEPFFMRYDRVFITTSSIENGEEKLKPLQQQQQQLKDQENGGGGGGGRFVKHMQRVLDGRYIINSGSGLLADDHVPLEDRRIDRMVTQNGNTISVPDLPGRYLSDHFGVLIDLEF